MDAGWIQMHARQESVHFEATASGGRAAVLRELPQDWKPHKRGTALCMDRLVSSFLNPEDLTLVHREKLPPDALVLSPREFKLDITPANSLDRLYMMEDETFHEWVDYRVTSQNFHAVLSIAGDQVQGLPRYAPPSLEEAILEAASLMPGSRVTYSAAAPVSNLEPEDRHSRTEINEEDLVVGGPAHLDLIRRILETDAKKLVVIHSCFVHPQAVRTLMPSFERAAKRNVNVELLWGQRTDELPDWSQQAFRDTRKIFENLTPVSGRKCGFRKAKRVLMLK
jgi:hypothetical protein